MDRHSSHSQRVPYARTERRKSLLSKVKDSVKEMLSPSWLTDLVSTVKKEQSPLSTSDSLIGQQQIPGVSMPGPAVLQHSPSGSGLHSHEFLPFQGQSPSLVNGQPRSVEFSRAITPSETMSTLPHGAVLPPPVVEFTSAQLPFARIADKTDSVLANEDTMSQRSDVSKSTSGCSSMVPQVEVSREPREGGAEKRKIPDSDGNDGASPLSSRQQPSAKRQRLHVNISNNKTWSHRFNESNIGINQSSLSRPAFNVSLFDSPVNESSILGSSFHESSFYPGKTSYGGKSSKSFRSQHLKPDLNKSLPGRLSVPVKAFMKAKPRANPDREAVTSSTAKRIMDALNKIPTPLSDARKIPINVPNQWTENPSFFAQNRKSPVNSGPPTQKLNVGSLATISKNRQVSSSPQQFIRTEQPSTSQGQRQDNRLMDSNGPSSGPSGKMRRDKSYHRPSAAARGGGMEEDEMEAEVPNLRSDFTLPVSQLPKISFSASSSSGATLLPGFSAPSATKSGFSAPGFSQGISFVTPSKPPLNFTFSTPIQQNQPEQKQPSPPVGGFQFSSPISVDKQATASPPAKTNKFSFASPISSTSPSMAVTFSVAPKPKPKTNGPVSLVDTDVVGIKPPTELKMGSVMDILGKSSKSSTDAAAPPTQSSQPAQSSQPTQSSQPSLSSMFKAAGWSCDVCLIKNKETDKKCAACQTPKPAKSTSGSGPTSTTSASGTSFPSQTTFKQTTPAGTWTCDSCLVKNKPDLSKCAACQSTKPGQSTNLSATGTSSQGQGLFKQTTPAGTWTCDSCLIKNKPDLSKCAACQSAKPGGSATPTFSSFGSTACKSTTWTCDTCLIKNDEEATVCAACSTSKPPAKSGFKPNNETLGDKFKPAAGQWNCEVCLVQNKSDISTCVACQTPKPSKPFKHPPGDWTCDTCLVSNKEKDVTCIACTYARPGPPRTQTVPSCAKSYSLSQAGEKSDIAVAKGGGFTFGGSSDSSKSDSTTTGFSFGASSSENKSSEPVMGGFKFGKSSSSTGGLKFGKSTIDSSAGATPSTGGFKFGALNSASSASIGTGFTFGAPTSSEGTNTVGGFKFGVPSSSTSSSESKESPSSFGSVTGLTSLTSSENKTGSEANSIQSDTTTIGGFKFGASVVASDKKPETASIENKTSEAPVKTGFNGFQFGKPSDSSNSSSLSSGASSANSNSLTSGLSFGMTAPTSDALKTTTSVPGGFSFGGTSNTASSSAGLPTATTTQSGMPPASIGGFSFSASNKSNTSTGSVTTSAAQMSGGFTFGGAAANNTQDSSKQETKSSIGGFVFGQKPPETSTSMTAPLTGFSFAQKTLPSDQSTTESTATKRSREEDSGASVGKKPAFSFGAGSTTGAFQFNKASTNSSSTAPFVFGQQNAPTPGTGFSFGSGGDKTTFGAVQPAEVKTGDAPVFSTSSFNFSASKSDSNADSIAKPHPFTFSASSSQPTAPLAFGSGSNNSVFGSTNSSFGSSSTPAFGVQNTNSTPSNTAFGGNLSQSPPFSELSTSHLQKPLFSTFISSAVQTCCPSSFTNAYNSSEESIFCASLPFEKIVKVRMEHQKDLATDVMSTEMLPSASWSWSSVNIADDEAAADDNDKISKSTSFFNEESPKSSSVQTSHFPLQNEEIQTKNKLVAVTNKAVMALKTGEEVHVQKAMKEMSCQTENVPGQKNLDSIVNDGNTKRDIEVKELGNLPRKSSISVQTVSIWSKEDLPMRAGSSLEQNCSKAGCSLCCVQKEAFDGNQGPKAKDVLSCCRLHHCSSIFGVVRSHYQCADSRNMCQCDHFVQSLCCREKHALLLGHGRNVKNSCLRVYDTVDASICKESIRNRNHTHECFKEARANPAAKDAYSYSLFHHSLPLITSSKCFDMITGSNIAPSVSFPSTSTLVAPRNIEMTEHRTGRSDWVYYSPHCYANVSFKQPSTSVFTSKMRISLLKLPDTSTYACIGQNTEGCRLNAVTSMAASDIAHLVNRGQTNITTPLTTTPMTTVTIATMPLLPNSVQTLTGAMPFRASILPPIMKAVTATSSLSSSVPALRSVSTCPGLFNFGQAAANVSVNCLQPSSVLMKNDIKIGHLVTTLSMLDQKPLSVMMNSGVSRFEKPVTFASEIYPHLVTTPISNNIVGFGIPTGSIFTAGQTSGFIKQTIPAAKDSQKKEQMLPFTFKFEQPATVLSNHTEDKFPSIFRFDQQEDNGFTGVNALTKAKCQGIFTFGATQSREKSTKASSEISFPSFQAQSPEFSTRSSPMSSNGFFKDISNPFSVLKSTNIAENIVKFGSRCTAAKSYSHSQPILGLESSRGTQSIQGQQLSTDQPMETGSCQGSSSLALSAGLRIVNPSQNRDEIQIGPKHAEVEDIWMEDSERSQNMDADKTMSVTTEYRGMQLAVQHPSQSVTSSIFAEEMDVVTSEKKAMFSFRDPIKVHERIEMRKMPSPQVEKCNKSILKTKTNEMVSAFSFTSMGGSESGGQMKEKRVAFNSNEDKNNSMVHDLGSSVFGGRKSFLDDHYKRSSKSVTFVEQNGNRARFGAAPSRSMVDERWPAMNTRSDIFIFTGQKSAPLSPLVSPKASTVATEPLNYNNKPESNRQPLSSIAEHNPPQITGLFIFKGATTKSSELSTIREQIEKKSKSNKCDESDSDASCSSSVDSESDYETDTDSGHSSDSDRSVSTSSSSIVHHHSSDRNKKDGDKKSTRQNRPNFFFTAFSGNGNYSSNAIVKAKRTDSVDVVVIHSDSSRLDWISHLDNIRFMPVFSCPVSLCPLFLQLLLEAQQPCNLQHRQDLGYSSLQQRCLKTMLPQYLPSTSAPHPVREPLRRKGSALDQLHHPPRIHSLSLLLVLVTEKYEELFGKLREINRNVSSLSC